ncbi:p14.2 [Trichoplusia ni granulovirus LBIV-12]|uniref:p14.2 n=2 Tax=Trichoplusia ni granulosis virus TaxID=10462 RepID=A0A1D8QL90_GVTN|nr:p14.2 [Trichoplusia ni granulovirus LBIV-12]AAC40851.1 p14.2 [Trichoplusia ni granulovirus]AOW41432.1 p14.2 [Trichoplusia ni granulovirus LBIV-12]
MVTLLFVAFINRTVERLNVTLKTVINVNESYAVTASFVVAILDVQHFVVGDHNFVVGIKRFFGSVFSVCRIKLSGIGNVFKVSFCGDLRLVHYIQLRFESFNFGAVVFCGVIVNLSVALVDQNYFVQ